MGSKPEEQRKFLIVFSLLCAQVVFCEAFDTLSKYARTRHMYPQVTEYEASHWRMPRSWDFREHSHPCKRKCGTSEPMTCYYYMVVHYDLTMGPACYAYLAPKHIYKIDGQEYVDASSLYSNRTFDDCKYSDGVEKEIVVVNGKYPGQSIEVCQGDTIVADVINSLRETTTLHWHGIHQSKAPHMDGVPHITQYPIEPGQAYRYRFEVDHIGTNWWHSHTNDQRAFGLAGPLIVRQPNAQNVHAALYNFDNSEHTIMLQDWVNSSSDIMPHNLLINGLGRNTNSDPTKPKRPTLYADFNVVRGARYRFRVIYNGITNCPLMFSIDKHDLVVIASDGNDIEPITVQKITFNAGERFDFVLHANQAVENYWIRIKGTNFCGKKRLHQEAILRYEGAKLQSKPKALISYGYEPTGVELNPVDKIPNDKNGPHIAVIDMNALSAPSLANPNRPHRTYYISMKMDLSGEQRFQMDDITFSMPKVSLLQSRNLGIGGYFCNKTQQADMGIDCRSSHCRCSNVIQVPIFQDVEFVVSTSSDSSHPIHLHGYSFRVVGMGSLGKNLIDNIEEIDMQQPLPRRLHGAPFKDTVQVPAFGYTIMRFYTDSPGYWLFHCHISPHAEKGMAVVVRVGEDAEMKMCPVSNCGLCSSVL